MQAIRVSLVEVNASHPVHRYVPHHGPETFHWERPEYAEFGKHCHPLHYGFVVEAGGELHWFSSALAALSRLNDEVEAIHMTGNLAEVSKPLQVVPLRIHAI